MTPISINKGLESMKKYQTHSKGFRFIKKRSSSIEKYPDLSKMDPNQLKRSRLVKEWIYTGVGTEL